jgi:hypothetical protein
MRARGPAVLDWVFRMVEPRQDGPFEAWGDLEPTMGPLIDYVGRYFLPWSQANAQALETGEAEFSVVLSGKAYVQPPQKYHAKSLAALRAKHQAVAGDGALRAVLSASGCAPVLAGG